MDNLGQPMFESRHDAGKQLAAKIRERRLTDPLVIAIANGGVLTGAEVARELGAELDVVLCKKLRAEGDSDQLLGAVCGRGTVYFNDNEGEQISTSDRFMHNQSVARIRELRDQLHSLRAIRSEAMIAGRSVIVVDDGLITGTSLISVLRAVREQDPKDLTAAVPVAPVSQIPIVSRWCDELICLLAAENMLTIGQYYTTFPEVDFEYVLYVLSEHAKHPTQQIRA